MEKETTWKKIIVFFSLVLLALQANRFTCQTLIESKFSAVISFGDRNSSRFLPILLEFFFWRFRLKMLIEKNDDDDNVERRRIKSCVDVYHWALDKPQKEISNRNKAQNIYGIE